MPPMLADADGAFRLADALDREARGLGAQRALLEHGDRRQLGIEQIEIGQRRRASSDAIGEAGELVLGRDLRHRHRALGERRDVAGDVVGRHHRLRRPTNTRRPTSSLSERSDSSTAPSRTPTPSDIERTATASAASAPARRAAVDETFGEIGQRGLIEK